MPEEADMTRSLIALLQGADGLSVRICGWADKIRNAKSVQFLVVRDHTGLIQVTNVRGKNPEIEALLNDLAPESAVDVEGTLVRNQNVKLGGMEIIPTRITVVGPAEKPLPLGIDPPLSVRQDWRYLDLRRPQMGLVFRMQTTVEHAMRQWWVDNGFTEIHSPKLMGHPSESGAELFHLPYFGGTAYLAQSPQFFKQMAVAAAFDRVFEIGPVFRANPSHTSRHDTEFTSVDVELSWVDSHDDVMAVEEQWLAHVLTVVKERHGEELRAMFGTEVVVPTLPFPRIPMAQAREILAGIGHPPDPSGDLDPAGERLLCRYVQETFGHEFVFVTDWPIGIRPFYHMRHADQPGLTKSFDLLWRGLEVTSGAQREHRPDILLAQALEKGLAKESIQFYLDFFRYGMPPHGGYGFGLTRMLMLLTGLGNVREVTFLHRSTDRLKP